MNVSHIWEGYVLFSRHGPVGFLGTRLQYAVFSVVAVRLVSLLFVGRVPDVVVVDEYACFCCRFFPFVRSWLRVSAAYPSPWDRRAYT